MKLKSYRANSVEDAIRLARLDLGSDALFLGSRPLEPSEDPQQGHEVTFVVLDPANGVAMKTQPLAGERLSEWLTERLGGFVEESAPPARVVNSAGAPVNGKSHSDAKPPIWDRLFSPKPDKAGKQQPWQPREVTASPAPSPAKSLGATSVGVNGKAPAHAAAHESPGGPPAASPEAATQARSDDTHADRRGYGQAENKKVTLPHWRDFLPATPDAPNEPVGEAPEPGAELIVGGDPRETKNADRTPVETQAVKAAATPTPVETAKEPAASPPERVSNEAPDSLTAELRQIRVLLGRALSGPRPLFAPDGRLLSHPRLAEIYGQLTGAEIEPFLAAQLVNGLEDAARQGADRKKLLTLLHAELAKLWQVCGQLGKPECDPRLVALVGPSGVGKTTSLGKLAVRFGVVQGRRLHLVSVDQQRVGAVEPLRAYAELLGAPLTVVEECEALPGALQPLTEGEPRQRPELVLIDTSGYGPADWARARRLAAVFAARADIDVHLALSLASKGSDLRRTVARYGIFQPGRLLFTKADETGSHGALLNESVRSGLPLSYVTTGQRVPEDIMPAAADYLTRLLLKNDLTQ